MASIRAYRLKDGSTRYGVRWRDEAGGEHWQPGGPRRKDAERLRIEIERKLVLGELHEQPSETFGDYVEAYLDRHGARAQASTVQRYRETLPRLAPITDVRLDALTVPMVDDLVVAIARKTPRQSEMGSAADQDGRPRRSSPRPSRPGRRARCTRDQPASEGAALPHLERGRAPGRAHARALQPARPGHGPDRSTPG